MTATAAREDVLTFESEDHLYRLNGTVVLSVTQAIELAGLCESEWFTEESRWRGIAVHRATHYLDEGDLDMTTVDPMIDGYLAAYVRFKEETRFRPGRIEQPRFHARLRYAGTPDRVVEEASEVIPRSVIDVKTGAPQPWHREQTAGYANLMPNPWLYRRFGLYLRRDGSYRLEEHPREAYPRDLARFQAALTVAQMRVDRGLA